MPTGSLAIMIKRGDETIVTKGDTVILPGDTIILSVPPYIPSEDEKLEEIVIEKGHKWCDQYIRSLRLKEDELIALILRGGETIIPDGHTKIHENDVVVVYR